MPMIAVTGELIPDRLVIGLSAFVGNAQGAAFPADAVTRYHLIDGYVVAPQAVLAAAYRLVPSLTLGASAGVVDATRIGCASFLLTSLSLAIRSWMSRSCWLSSRTPLP